MVPEDSVSMTKEMIMADIDVAMGGHVAEKLIIGSSKITSGCGSDLEGATSMAYRAVRMFGMFGEEGAGYISADPEQTSEKYNAMVDKQVKDILEASFQRVSNLLNVKEKELRSLSKNLFQHDYLDAEEIKNVIEGKEIKKEKVRTWEPKEPQYLIRF